MILSEETIAAIVAAHSPPVPAPGSVQEPVVVIEDISVEQLPDEVDNLGIIDIDKEAEVGPREEEESHLCKKSVYCKKKFCSNGELQKHIVKFHTEEGKKFSCTSCGKRFARRQQLTEHCKTHNKEIVKCEVCHMVKRDNNKLKIHMEQYHSEEVSTCHKCRNTFKTRIELRNHNKSCSRAIRKKQKKGDPVSATASVETVIDPEDSPIFQSIAQSSSESPTVVQRLNLSQLNPVSEKLVEKELNFTQF